MIYFFLSLIQKLSLYKYTISKIIQINIFNDKNIDFKLKFAKTAIF